MEDIWNQNLKLYRVWMRRGEIYNDYAKQYNLSLPSLLTLYALYDATKQYTQNDISKMWCLPKQTINSCVNTLVKQNWVKLVPFKDSKKLKAIELTEEGSLFCLDVIKPLVEIEMASLSSFEPDELQQLVMLSEKFNDMLQKKIENQ